MDLTARIGAPLAGVATPRATVNPLLFADWGRMNRLFTRTMWAIAAILVCVVCIAVAAPGAASHSAPPAHPVVAAAAGSSR